MARRRQFFFDLRGGRNGADPPLTIADDQVQEALNMDYFDGGLGRKRGGSASLALTGGTAFSGGIQSLGTYIPGASIAASELWAVDGAATPVCKRLAGGVSWADVTLKEAIASAPQDVVFATLNGKLYMAYDSTVDRLLVWDGTAHRRVGVGTPAAATVANTGAGSYAATLRYYKVAYTVQSGGVTVRRSELSANVSFTPSGTGTAARITKPASISEGETHWELYGSSDNTTYYRLATTAVATTTYDDSAAPSSYSTNTAQDLDGHNTVPTSVKYLISDGNRLIMAGAWESGGKNSRVWFTPVLGSTATSSVPNGIGDDERIPFTTSQSNWVDLDENDGGYITGLGGPIQGSVYVFKYRQIWKLIPTGDVDTPFRPIAISKAVGCIAHKSIVTGRDSQGRPALYFLSAEGPYRIGGDGLQYLGRDVEDRWSLISLGATTVVAHAIYHPAKNQVWFWIATGTNDPDEVLVFDCIQGALLDEKGRIRKGWSRFDGNLAGARCSALFSNTVGASMSRDLKPYIGRSTGTVILKGDTTDTDDAGTAFQAYTLLRPFSPEPGRNFSVSESHLLANVQAGVTITQTLTRDWGLETNTSTASLTASGSESRKLVKFEGGELSECGTLSVQLGDSAAAANTWTLDGYLVDLDIEELR